MKAKLIPSNIITIELDGKPVQGSFKLESEWEGFMKLVCDSPHNTIIVYKPKSPTNPWNFILPIFGGGAQTVGNIEAVVTEVVASTIKP
jgi:hypothetical protein